MDRRRVITLALALLLCASPSWARFSGMIGMWGDKGAAAPTLVAEQATVNDSRSGLSFTIGQSFTSATAGTLDHIEVYLSSAGTSVTCRIGGSDDLETVYSEELTSSVSGTGWKSVASVSHPSIPTGSTIYFLCTTDGAFGFNDGGSDLYTAGVYLYNPETPVPVWYTSGTVETRDLAFRVYIQ